MKNNLICDKKGIAIGQVFIFMVAAITFALIMIFGYKTISTFLSKGETVEFAQFKNDIEQSVKKIYTEYGAIRIEEYSLPPRYEQICFVDLNYKALPEEVKRLCSKDALACDVWEEAQNHLQSEADAYEMIDENVFLRPQAPVKIKLFSFTIADENDPSLKKGFLCEEIRGGIFSLYLEGKGDHTEISAKTTQ